MTCLESLWISVVETRILEKRIELWDMPVGALENIFGALECGPAAVPIWALRCGSRAASLDPGDCTLRFLGCGFEVAP